jgi:hypothetical protein
MPGGRDENRLSVWLKFYDFGLYNKQAGNFILSLLLLLEKAFL